MRYSVKPVSYTHLDVYKRQDDDRFHSVVITDLLEKFRKAKVPAEVHLYAQGGHAFNMGNRSKLASIHDWPQRMADWLADSGYLNLASSPEK